MNASKMTNILHSLAGTLKEYTRKNGVMAAGIFLLDSGIEIIRNPQFNKGMAFSEEERGKLYLRGLLPPKVMPMSTQVVITSLN